MLTKKYKSSYIKDDKMFLNIQNFLSTESLFSHPDFVAGPQNLDFIKNVCKILVIGAGGLGCEILKNLCCLGFSSIDLIDMDTIELSNLNRQFLFRETDIGESKAIVAAKYFEKYKPWCKIIPKFAKIQDFDSNFYSKYHIIICGLDSIIARRWINNMLISLLKYTDGNIDPSSIIPLVDGGSEGFKGNVRVILPGITACLDCTLDLYPPQVNFPLCTLANRPRLPEHCVEYVRLVLWDKCNPFGNDVAIDSDNADHVDWIFQKSIERAQEFNIKGVTLFLAQGVIKRLIPAVASTNAIIAAVCANECFKIATNCYLPVNNFLFNDTDGVYCYSYDTDKKDDCVACSLKILNIPVHFEDTLQKFVTFLKEDPALQLKSPSIYVNVNGKSKTLYVEGIKDLEVKTSLNLQKSLQQLELYPDVLIDVVDVTNPKNLIFKLKNI